MTQLQGGSTQTIYGPIMKGYKKPYKPISMCRFETYKPNKKKLAVFFLSSNTLFVVFH